MVSQGSKQLRKAPPQKQKSKLCTDSLAEWSKAVDSSSTIFGCVGSNPTAVIISPGDWKKYICTNPCNGMTLLREFTCLLKWHGGASLLKRTVQLCGTGEHALPVDVEWSSETDMPCTRKNKSQLDSKRRRHVRQEPCVLKQRAEMTKLKPTHGSTLHKCTDYLFATWRLATLCCLILEPKWSIAICQFRLHMHINPRKQPCC